MPVYNRASAVRRAIDSVLAQSFTDFELIVVDDGSTDGSGDIAAEPADPRVRLLRLDRNSGSNAARNRGIEASDAPLISFLDSDDIYLPHKLETVAELFERQPDLDVLLDSFTKIYPAGDRRSEAERRNPAIDSTEEFVAALFARRLWKATSAITVRREAAVRAGMFDETLKRRQDFDFLIRLAKSSRCASSDRTLWVKTWTRGAISDDPGSFIAATLELCRRHPEYVANPDYRPGLARDFTLHLARHLRAGRIGSAGRDLSALRREFGTTEAARLLAQGGRELIRRARTKAG